jgi:hypothetical protein
LRSEIDEIEGQLGRGALPSMQHIVNVRTELLGIQYAQFDQQRPLPEVGALIARIMDAYNRACQLESLHFQQRASGSTHNEANSGSFSVTNSLHTSNSVFLLNPTPDGPAQFILSPGAYYVAPPAALDAQSPPQLPQNAAMPENMVRQAIQNQQRRGNNVEQADLARHIGRIWLFVRLWFFCYLISEPGTWRRYIMVAASLLAALLSGTGIPQRIMHAVVNPTLRHVEAFARAGGPADPAPANNDAPRAFTMGEEVRRVHRAVLLLVASIVPGLGEREVEAHHAAEAEAERRRQEQQAQTAEAEAGSTNSTAEQEAPVSQPGPTPAAQD